MSICTFGSRLDRCLLYAAGTVVAVGTGETHCDSTGLERPWWHMLQRYRLALFDISFGERSQADRTSVVAPLEQVKSLLSERRTTHSALLLPQTQLQLCESSQLDPTLGCQDPDVQPRFTTPLVAYASSRPRIARRLPRRGERVGDPATPLTDAIAVKPSLNQTPFGQCWPLAWILNFARGSIDFDASGPICRRSPATTVGRAVSTGAVNQIGPYPPTRHWRLMDCRRKLGPGT